MTSHPRRRDDRSAVDPRAGYHHDHPSDRRRNRSATLPANAYEQRSSNFNDARPHRQDPHYPTVPYSSYQPSAAQPAPPAPTSKAYQHATRPSAQYPSSGYQYPQPSSYQPQHPLSAYPVPGSSRKPHTDPPDPKPSRRPPPSHQPPYEHVSSGEDMPKAPRHSSRAAHSNTQPLFSAPPIHAVWNPPRDNSSSRRPKDPYRARERDQDRERERDRDRDRERDRPTAELDSRYRDRTRSDRHRERAAEVRYQEPTKSKHHDRRKDSDTDGVLYFEQRNNSKTSLSGREGVRESSSGHRRHRTEDGTTGRRQQPENMQTPITTLPSQSTFVPQPDVQQTGEPPPAPRVMPVYLPPKVKSQRSHREGRPPTTQGAQSGSDTERTMAKFRMERTPSGPAVQRSDAHVSSSTRDRGSHDIQRDDTRRLEAKYGALQDARQPLAPINVDIPLVTPGFNASTLPVETKPSNVPQIVSIRAGQGPSDPHDVHFKSSAISHLDAPQEIVVHPPTSASIIKPSSHVRSQSSETRVQPDRPRVAERSRAEPHGDDLPPGQLVSTHDPSRAPPAPISKSHSYSRGNLEIGTDHPTTSQLHGRPSSRSAHRSFSSNSIPPAVIGPRPLRSVSQGPPQNEISTRPPSVSQYVSTIPPTVNQNSVPPPTSYHNGHTHGTLASTQPSPKYTSLAHATSAQQASSTLPSVRPSPIIVPQVLSTSSRPPTRDGAHAEIPHTLQQPPDRHLGMADRLGPQQNTVKASWVVQTSATVKSKISPEEKYLRDHQFNSETSRAQLRQMLSQNDDSYHRVSSTMMKASQATTPSAASQRNSPGVRTRDTSFGTPRGTLTSNSPRSNAVKETTTPEFVPRQNLSGPPQIAIVGATPVSINQDLPQSRIDTTFLVPPFPAPTPAPRTSTSPQDQPTHSTVRDTSSSSYQPQLAPVHAPSLFQPYRPPPPSPEENGQFSPPPLPVPAPRGLEDSPPLPIETRTSEIIPICSQTDSHPQSHVHSTPEVQSEMIHISSQPSVPPQLMSSRTMNAVRSDNEAPIVNGPTALAYTDTKSLKSPSLAQSIEVPVLDQEIIGPVPLLVSQPSVASMRPRPKVTIEDVSDGSPVIGKAISASAPVATPPVLPSRHQSSQHNAVTNANLAAKPVVSDQTHKSSPQLATKDSTLNRSTGPAIMSVVPPMPPPPSVIPPTPRMTSPMHPTFVASTQTAPGQRVASHIISSRTHQRAAEILQAGKLSATNPGVVDKSTTIPVQSIPNLTIASQQQSADGAGPSVSRPPHISVTASTSTTTLTAKVTAQTNGLGTSVGQSGPHVSSPSTGTNTQPSAPEQLRPQSSRPGTLSNPVDATSPTVMPPTAVRNEHLIMDPTRPRDAASRHPAHLAQIHPTSARPGTSSTTAHITSQSSNHHRVISLPVTPSSSAGQRPISPRKYSQPILPATVSTQPFPSRPTVAESQSARAPVTGHTLAPALVQSTRLPPPDRILDSDMLKTPSSIAPSPMLNPGTSNPVSRTDIIPTRSRRPSTESRDDKKKPSGLFGLFRTRTLSSKATDPQAISTVTRASVDQGKALPDASISGAVATTSMHRGVNSNLASTPHITSQSKPRNKMPDSVGVPPPPTLATREQKEATSHVLNPFKYLSMNRRHRTVSAASLDVCDGNTATNTVIGSPDHSAISQAQPLPHIIPPDVRDPLVAASEWRDKEEAERRTRKANRIRRPGVTFDIEEDSPMSSIANKRKKLVRRPSGRAATPGPPRG